MYISKSALCSVHCVPTFRVVCKGDKVSALETAVETEGRQFIVLPKIAEKNLAEKKNRIEHNYIEYNC